MISGYLATFEFLVSLPEYRTNGMAQLALKKAVEAVYFFYE